MCSHSQLNFFATRTPMGFYDLPSDLVGSILSQWITTPELAHLDSSTTNSRDRKLFLELVHQRHFVSSGLDQTSVTNDYFQWLVMRNVRIRSLNLTSRSSFSSNTFSSVLQLQHFIQEIADLRADFTGSRLTECALGILKKCSTQIQSLAIANSNLTDHDLQGIIRTADNGDGFVSLKTIDASVCKVSNNSLTSLLKICPNLEEIKLAAADNIDDMTIEKLVQYCPKLRKITLDDCLRITDASITAIALGCKSLELLEVRRCPNLTDVALESLVKNTKDTLKELSLNGCLELSDHTLRSIADNSMELVRLNVSFCNKMSDEGAWLVLNYCTRLQHLAMNFNTRITKEEYQRMKSTFENKCSIQCIQFLEGDSS